MTDSPRKTPEHQPWLIHYTPATATVPTEQATATYDSLSECEKACKLLALANHGVTFRPVKYGRSFTASKVEKVVLT